MVESGRAPDVKPMRTPGRTDDGRVEEEEREEGGGEVCCSSVSQLGLIGLNDVLCFIFHPH